MTNRTKRGLQHAALSPLVGVGCVLGGIALGVTAPYWYTVLGLKRGELEDQAEAIAAALNQKVAKAPKGARAKVPSGKRVTESDVKRLLNIAKQLAAGDIEPSAAITKFKRAAGNKPALQEIAAGFEQRMTT